MTDYETLVSEAISIPELVGTRRQPKKRVVHVDRRTREGRAYQRSQGRKSRDYMDMSSMPFISLDGEGITYTDASGEDKAQSYVLLGASTGEHIIADPLEEGLGTERCLRYLLRLKQTYPKAIFVGFAIGYDSEQIMKDLTQEQLTHLHTHNVLRWKSSRGNHYKIRYIPKKWFMVSAEINGKYWTCRVFDVWSFFNTSFVVALEQYFPDIPTEDIDHIREGKNKRNDFTVDQLYDEVIPYWRLELKYTVDLMEKYRSLLSTIDVHPSSWHGPGALATAANKKHGIKAHMNQDLPEPIKNASQFAFQAGHMEKLVTGRAHKPVFVFDINSAYPAGLVKCPSLKGRSWLHRVFDKRWTHHPSDIQDYGMYLLTYQCYGWNPFGVQPLFRRSVDTRISYPMNVRGWYWGPEVKAAMASGGFISLEQGWEMDLTDVEYPFTWVKDEYDLRLRWKAENNPAQLAIKNELNSMFGKFAQRTGWRPENDNIPAWFQYEWSGYITSQTRATMYHAARLCGDELIGIETDAIITTRDLRRDLAVGNQLGEWSVSEYRDIVYLQTGQYFLLTGITEWSEALERKGYQRDKDGGIWKNKFRGFDKKSLTIDAALEFLAETRFDVSSHPGRGVSVLDVCIKGLTCTRFMTSRGAIHANQFDDWRKWLTKPKQLNVLIDSKRIHEPMLCKLCKSGKVMGIDGLHTMVQSDHFHDRTTDRYESYAAQLPWRSVEGEARRRDPLDQSFEDPSLDPDPT